MSKNGSDRAVGSLKALIAARSAPLAPKPPRTAEPIADDTPYENLDQLTVTAGPRSLLEELPTDLTRGRPLLALLYDWRLALVVDLLTNKEELHLVGVASQPEHWIVTPPIQAIADWRFAETSHGLYLLGTPGPYHLSNSMQELVLRTLHDGGLRHERQLPVGRYAAETRGESGGRVLFAPDIPRVAPTAEMDLTQIIRQNRSVVELGLANEAELAGLMHWLPPSQGSERILSNWNIVAIRELTTGETSCHVLGERREGGARITSPILALAAHMDFVQTQNSTYRLGTPGDGDPPMLHLMTVARALYDWGLDEAFGLDVVMPEELLPLLWTSLPLPEVDWEGESL